MNKGTINNPASFGQAIISPSIIPGDTLYLRGGTYAGDWTISINGTAEAPITIRPYENEPVTIDGSLRILGNYITLLDLDGDDTIHTDQTTITPGWYAIGKGFKMHGCHIKKQHASGLAWYGNGPGEVSENWIEDNGYQDGEGNNHGYCIYTHNQTTGEHTIQRNLMKPRYEKYALHCYTGSNIPIYDMHIFNNVFDGPVHAGGGRGLKDFRFHGNIVNSFWVQLGKYLYSQEWANDGTSIIDNVFYKSHYSVNDGNENSWANLVESGNTAYSPYSPSDYNRSGYTVEDTPAEWSMFIPFTISERWAGIQVSIVGGVFSAEIVAI